MRLSSGSVSVNATRVLQPSKAAALLQYIKGGKSAASLYTRVIVNAMSFYDYFGCFFSLVILHMSCIIGTKCAHNSYSRPQNRQLYYTPDNTYICNPISILYIHIYLAGAGCSVVIFEGVSRVYIINTKRVMTIYTGVHI